MASSKLIVEFFSADICKGSVRKLNNLVRHHEQTLKLRHFYEVRQSIDPDFDNGCVYRVIVKEGIIWASSCDMI